MRLDVYYNNTTLSVDHEPLPCVLIWPLQFYAGLTCNTQVKHLEAGCVAVVEIEDNTAAWAGEFVVVLISVDKEAAARGHP